MYGGARGGGKTDAGMAWLLRHINNPLYRALIIRKNYIDLADWIDRARYMYRGCNAHFAGKPVEIKFPSGATFRAGHLKDPSSFENYLGQEYQRMLIEELTLIPQQELYEKLLFSCRSTVKDLKPQVFATTNPGGPGHAWVKERFIDVKSDKGELIPWGTPYIYEAELKNPLTGMMQLIRRDRIFIHAQVEDNPSLVENDPGYVLMLDQLKKTNEGLYRAWRYGDWDVAPGQVFAEFRRKTHVVAGFEIPKHWKRYVAIDWGANAPSSVGWYAVDEDRRTYLYREIYMNSTKFQEAYGVPLTAGRLAKVILAVTKKNNEDYEYAVADPSLWNKILELKDQKEDQGESRAEIMINAGLRLIKGDNDRENGLAKIREVFSLAPDGKPYYQIFANCSDTIRTYPSLTYDPIKIEDVDTDGDDHCYDRDRYLFMSRPQQADVEKNEERTIIQTHYEKLVRKMKSEEQNDNYYEEVKW